MKECEELEVYSFILNFGTRWRWVVSFTSRPFYPRISAPGTHCIVDSQSRSGCCAEEVSFLCWESNHEWSVVKSVTNHYTDWAMPFPKSKLCGRIILCAVGEEPSHYVTTMNYLYVAPCISKIHWVLHTNKFTKFISYISLKLYTLNHFHRSYMFRQHIAYHHQGARIFLLAKVTA
jgi:hypothetical protein